MVVAASVVGAGALIGWAVTSSPAPVQDRPHPALAAVRTGIVTGHLQACFGIATKPRPVTPGTVFALRGTLTSMPDGPGTWRLVFPTEPAVASEHISDNYAQTFRFALPPGHYVLAGRYDRAPEDGYATFTQVTITGGAVARADLPNLCK